MSIVKNNKKEIIIFIIILLIELVIFLPWIKGHYATDTYKIIDIGYKEAARGSLRDGRIFMYFIGNIANLLDISVEGYVRVLLILALIVSTLSVLLIRKIILEYVKENNIADVIITTLLSFVTIFNFMYLENLYYAEAFVMSISVFLNIYVAKLLVDESKRCKIKALVLEIIAIFMYQGTAGTFIAMYGLFILMKYPNNYKTVMKKFLKDIVIFIVAILINVFFVKFFEYKFNIHQRRMGNAFSIFYNIYFIFRFIGYVLRYTCGLFKRDLLLEIVAIISIITVATSYKTENRTYVLNYMIIFGITILSAFSTNILSLSCLNAGRIKFSMGALVGILFIYIFCKIKEFNNKGIWKGLLTIILCIYSIINILNYSIIINEHIEVNKLEKETVKDLGKQITKYEEENSCKINYIKKIIMPGDAHYEQIKTKSTITADAVHCSWAAVEVINYYLNKNYIGEYISNKQYEEILKKNNIKRNNVILFKDTLFIEIYDY